MTGIKIDVKSGSVIAALPWVFLFGGFALYGLGTARGVTILDSGEFLGVAATLGVAHPTGYPLYALLGQLATLFPAGDPAFLINLVSAAAGAGGAFFMAAAAAEFAAAWESNAARVAAVAAAGVVTLAGRTLWSVSTLAEVYALNACLWAALLWAAARLRRHGVGRDLLIGAFLAGLALANHLTVALFLPAAALIAWPGRERARALAPVLPAAAAVFLAALSVNLYVPLRASRHPVFNWNDPSTAGSAVAHFSAFQYQGNFWEEGLAGAREAATEYGRSAFANVTPLAVFIVPGLMWLGRRGLRLAGAGLVLFYVGYAAYCAVYDIPDIYYYFIPLHLAAAFAGAVGVGAAVSFLAERRPRGRVWYAAAAAAAITAAGAAAFGANFPYGHRADHFFAERYGRRVLAALPARAVFFPSGDTNTFISWYNVYGRGLRPDVCPVDQIRLAGRGYLTALAARYPEVALPEEGEVRLLAERAIARGEFDVGEAVFSSSDDFILPEVLADIIAENAGRRPMFWGLGDQGKRLQRYIVPYDLVMEVATEEPPPAEVRRRARRAIAALTGLMAEVEAAGPGQLRDPFFQRLVGVYYSGLSGHLAFRGIYADQEKLFLSYVRLVPDDVNGYYNLGTIYLVTGRPEEAAANFRRAAELAPERALIRARLAQALYAAGRPEAAAAVAATLEGEEATEVGYVRGALLREQGEVEAALAAFEAAAPYHAAKAEFWWEYGVTLDRAGDYRAAGEAFGESLALNPHASYVYTARGVNYLRLGETEAARRDFEAAVARNPEEAQAYYNLACISAREGETAEALRHLEAALEGNPGRYAALAADDPDLASCRGLPAFERLLAAAAAEEAEAKP